MPPVTYIKSLFCFSPKITQWVRKFIKSQTKNIVKLKSNSRKIVLIFAKIKIVFSVENENYPKTNSVNLIDLISRVYFIVLCRFSVVFLHATHLEKHIKNNIQKFEYVR